MSGNTSSPSPQFASIAEIRKVWSFIPAQSAGPILLRAIKPKGCTSDLPTQDYLYSAREFPDVEARKCAFEHEAARLNNLGYNVYVVMNAIGAGFNNRRGARRSVADKDISCRTNLLVDIDRASVASCPASVEELGAAMDAALAVRGFLVGQGWPQPAGVFSGNGFHLYWPLDALPNDQVATDAIKALLRTLAAKFDTAEARVDTAVYNASRITKVPGTIARKGHETTSRTFRMARVLGPAQGPAVTLAQIEAVTSPLQPAASKRAQAARHPQHYRQPDTPRQRARLADQLAHISADCDYGRYSEVIWAILSTGWHDAPGIARNWSLTAPHRFDAPKFDRLIADYDPDHPAKLTLGTITMRAREGGWNE